ncbi:HAD hydrolase-like protein [Dactylosporangium aurantiacum]|uniref:HAD hydrolase-like protein n=1 Tax=Dactylosporangium aurantiacum TaxID=35754 RepID=A0A9Q9IMT2_9ACTN|nr:HAD hydrolase-like protein [Dactylosporangium aurantiacum]MDG6106119.1 HAD hydrolase-like protein [Dactylosporangium aurantiacum]UWZ55843.1 HAD hydrolase-like protein [Dactylosporangium aurantiacum]
MTDHQALRALLDRSRAILLDFDGPVCSIFGGYPAPMIAAELLNLLDTRGVQLGDDIRTETDPMEVLRWSATLGKPELTREVEDALCRAELLAAASAIPEPYGREVIITAREAGKPVAIVSNNSAAAIEAYLDAHRLKQHIAYIAGRAYAQPDRMKPNPEPIWRATAAVDVEPAASVLIGDSLFDIEGAQNAGVPVIAYANKPPKVQRFTDAHADIVLTSMGDIAAALLPSARQR